MLKKVKIFWLCLVMSMGIAGTVHAASYERWETVDEGERQEHAQMQGLLRASEASPKAWQKINGVCYNGSGQKITGAITRGIDVSEWQGVINWNKVKNSDIDFAFVRVAYGTGYIDKQYAANMKNAEAAGVPVGTYIYSTATTTAGALKEAKLVISKMKGYKVSYPVVFDLEYSKMGQLSRTQVAKLALTFCNEVKRAGYYPMVYCNTNWYDEKVDWSLLPGIDVWVARYGDKILAPSRSDYDYTIWQSTDGDGGGVLNSTKGLVDGIPVWNNVDVNFGYVDYTRIIQPRTAPLASYDASSQPETPTPTPKPTATSKPTATPKPTATSKPTATPKPTVKNGWKTEGGKTYYYKNDVKLKGWQKIGGKYYYFNSIYGYIYKNALLTSSKKNICYMDSRGARVSNQWVTSKNKRYYIGSNGYAVKGFQKIGGKLYYFHKANAYMTKNCKVITTSGNIYYMGSNGVSCANGFYTIKENGVKNTYYFDKNGRAYKGWHTIKGKKYYFYKGTSKKSGVRAQSVTLTSSTGLVSVFDKNGVCTKQYRKR